MYLKEQFNLKIPDREVQSYYQIATALDNTFVVDAKFVTGESMQTKKTTRKIIHQNVDGK